MVRMMKNEKEELRKQIEKHKQNCIVLVWVIIVIISTYIITIFLYDTQLDKYLIRTEDLQKEISLLTKENSRQKDVIKYLSKTKNDFNPEATLVK